MGLYLSKDSLSASSALWAQLFSIREKIHLGLPQLDPFQRPKNQSRLGPLKGLRCAIRAPLRQSEISAKIKEHQVVNRILDTPVTLNIQEVLASSTHLSDQITEMLKRKNPKPAHAAFYSLNFNDILDKESLIRLRMECNGRPVIAIIDTGSELNVVNKAICTDIDIPMNARRKLTMNDANGGKGVLQGHLTKVPLTCGGIMTYANMYVGDKVPFDMLLGRPWQRANFVSIKEKLDGTYVVFKHPNDPKNKYEVKSMTEKKDHDNTPGPKTPNFASASPYIPVCATIIASTEYQELIQPQMDITGQYQAPPQLDSHIKLSKSKYSINEYIAKERQSAGHPNGDTQSAEHLDESMDVKIADSYDPYPHSKNNGVKDNGVLVRKPQQDINLPAQ